MRETPSGTSENKARLAYDHYIQYLADGVMMDLDEAIRISRELLGRSPPGGPDFAWPANHLAICLATRFTSQGVLADLEDAIALHQQVLDFRPKGHPERAMSLNDLGDCLGNRFKSQGELPDLEKAIALHEQASQLGHPKQHLSLNNLADCLIERFRLQGKMDDLERAMSLHQKALALCPVGHADRPISLNNLAACCRLKFKSLGLLESLEEAITLHKEALGLHPTGHPGQSMSLNNLADCFAARFSSWNQEDDLEEAISLSQQAMDVYLVGHPGRSMSLINLAEWHALRYKSYGKLVDLERAISLGQEALALCSVGHQHRSLALNNHAKQLAVRFTLKGALADLEEAVSLWHEALELYSHGTKPWYEVAKCLITSLEERFNHSFSLTDIEEVTQLHQSLRVAQPNSYSPITPKNIPGLKLLGVVVDNIVYNTLETLPPRLFNTDTGILCTRDLQLLAFRQSPKYHDLMESGDIHITSGDWQPRLDHIHETISSYFQYVTLSHKWGASEPLLRDIAGHGSVYVMSGKDGLPKLQNFCQTVAKQGYSWAWSDTCCIDQTNSVELQEAIGSMFSWYRRSALTIVHLADISSASPSSALSGSIWFKRGWTLQELLAPHTMLFYTKEWELYMNCISNHKEDANVLKELARAAGIPTECLTDFRPGIQDARSRLQWASSRRTTRPEDIAYSLFGVFDLHLPVLYGENKEKALGRLLQEIISQSGDTSVLDWVGEASSFHSCFPASITCYRSAPYVRPPMSDVAMERSISRLQRLVSPDDARKLHDKLASCVLPRFSNRRLALPCIIYRVQAVKLKRTHLDVRMYEIRALGLRPIEITSSDELMQGSHNLPYILIRPWNRKLIDWSEDDDATAVYSLLVQLEQSFRGIMLVQLPHREYKRILSSRPIVTRIEDPASVINVEPTILDIV